MNLCRLADRQVPNRSSCRGLVFSLEDDGGSRVSPLEDVALFLRVLLPEITLVT
jgi:hypothetical protein